MATLLQIVQNVAERLGQGRPTVIMGSTDPKVRQFKGLLEQGLDDLVTRGAWQELTTEYTWTTLANENQGNIHTGLGSAPVATVGLWMILPLTLWDRTNIFPLYGPMSPQNWQAMKAWVVNGPHYQFRIRGNSFLVNPAPTAGLTWAFEYLSKYAIGDTSAGTYTDRFTADDDTVRLPQQVAEMDLQWRWLKAKGLGYAEDFASAERLISQYLGTSGMKPVVRLDNRPVDEARPAIFVPQGNWNL